jgi:curli production assembly/transport component CsgG
MKNTIISLAVVALLSGCATGSALREKMTGEQFDAPKVEESKFLKKKENSIKPPLGGPIPVAVYGFTDKTGQRKSMPNIASLSSAVTQGAESYLIKALQDVGEQRWFTVLERVGLDNLIKERQMIRQMREQYQGRDAKQLPPMMFAGIIMEGGIVGYDSNTLTGGSGVRIFGIGASTQYQSDTVTVTLRTVSVSTGEILTSVTVTKTVLSYMDKMTLLRFVGDGTTVGANATALEGEIGGSINESINKAIDVAVQAAVVQTINEGARKGHWAFKTDIFPAVQLESKIEPKVEPKVEEKIETKVEEKKDVVVQSQTKSETKTETLPPAPAEVKAEEKKVEVKPIEAKPIQETARPLFGQRTLTENSFLYASENEASTRKWWIPKGTVVDVKQPGIEGWWRVIMADGTGRGGWIQNSKLGN